MKKFILLFLLLIPFTYSNAQITDGLVLNYAMDGNAIDLTGNGNDGTLINVTSTSDQNENADSALEFDGSASITIPNSPIIKPDLPLTVSMMVKIEQTEIGQSLYHSGIVDNDYVGFFVNVTPKGQVMAHIGGNKGGIINQNRRSFLSDDSLTFDEWQRLTVVINSFDDMKIYIDCVESTGVYSGSGSTTIVYSDAEGKIGKSQSSPNFPDGIFFQGALDEVYLWNRNLAAQEIEDVCNGVLSSTQEIVEVDINLYPVPSVHDVNVSLGKALSLGDLNYMLVASNGFILEKNKIVSHDFHIDLNPYKSGVYFLIFHRYGQVVGKAKFSKLAK